MDWILDRLAIGSFQDANDAFVDKSVDVAVCVATEAPETKMVKCEKYGLSTTTIDTNAMQDAIEAVHHHLWNGRRVLVYCSEGVNRSPLVVVAYLHSCGYNISSAWKLVKFNRKQAILEKWMVERLRDFFKQQGYPAVK